MGHRILHWSRRTLLGSAALALLLGSVAAAAAGSSGASAACSAEVVLDPGHGGDDTGAVNGALVEKALNLEVALRAETILEADGYTVELTRRDNDQALGNSERGEFANACGALVLVSIHFNALSDPSVNYTKTFWGKPRKDEAFSWAMHEALWPALRLDTSGVETNLTDGGVGQFAHGALLQATMPATLVESVFLSNPEEAQRLADPHGARLGQIAWAIAAGVEGWLGTVDANQRPIANDDAYSVVAGETLTVEAPGVLANDGDPDGDPLTARVVAGPSGGSLSLNPDGSFSYAPAVGTTGDSFGYVANDGAADSDVATVAIAVTGAELTTPAAPSHLTATQSGVRGRNATIDLAWTDNAGDEAGYRIYRREDGTADWAVIQDYLPADTTAAQDRVRTGATYHYAVAAFNDAGDSAWATTTVTATASGATTAAPGVVGSRVVAVAAGVGRGAADDAAAPALAVPGPAETAVAVA